jgi:dimethylargininase
MTWTFAVTRAVPPSIVRCELSHLERQPIDPDRAAAQHAAYEAVLDRLGCRLLRAAPAPDHPDSVFVEDVAVVLDEVAVLTRPGAESRRGEVEGVAAVLAGHRPLRRLEPPATLDGGDVLRLGRTLLVGRTARTNPEGIAQLEAVAGPLGYRVRSVPVNGCLHLKTAVTAIAPDTLLFNPAWVDRAGFPGYTLLEVDPAEPAAANVLRVGHTLLVATAHPRTRRRLEERGLATIPVDVSELARAEAGLTCCSILFRASPPPPAPAGPERTVPSRRP